MEYMESDEMLQNQTQAGKVRQLNVCLGHVVVKIQNFNKACKSEASVEFWPKEENCFAYIGLVNSRSETHL